jgi:hypothetical protein
MNTRRRRRRTQKRTLQLTALNDGLGMAEIEDAALKRRLYKSRNN